MNSTRSNTSPPGGEKEPQSPEPDVEPTKLLGEPSPDDLKPPKEEPMSSTSSETPAETEIVLKPVNCEEIDATNTIDDDITAIKALPPLDEATVYKNISDTDKSQLALDKKKAEQKADEKLGNATSKADDELAQAEKDFASAERKYENDKTILAKNVCLAREEKLLKYKGCLKSLEKKNCPETVPPDKAAICLAQLQQDLAEIDKAYFEEVLKIEIAKAAAQCKLDQAKLAFGYNKKIAEAENSVDQGKALVKYRTDMSGALAKCTT